MTAGRPDLSAPTGDLLPGARAVRTIGIVSPGAMGSALGRAWATAGVRVVATVVGRSERTAGLASGLELLPDLDAVVAAGDLVVSICPPAAAEAVLASVIEASRATGTTPLLLEANAVSPERVAALAAQAAAAGLDLVDGSVSGGPPEPGSDTMLYLSGARAAEVTRVPAVGLRRTVVGDRVGQASAVKMCTASVYKGTTAVWVQALQTAAALDVLAPVLADLAEELPVQVEGAARRVAVAAAKSARFVDEMESIADTQGSAGASPELFAGMAAVYRRLAATPLAALSPEEAAALTDLRDVLSRLT
ncbi:NAD(P)-dependent oxidoreductase [Terrabacter sp. Soil810]|uniref:NAD(P)-dependent oxidoreductase n=1 Tax=Terrabacter sp. Soil810 TaxID=1736418 RepID=UPI001911153D|nr:NAD(P)-dependent oxidoreductase [Terrabacter sp. Soil810]